MFPEGPNCYMLLSKVWDYEVREEPAVSTLQVICSLENSSFFRLRQKHGGWKRIKSGFKTCTQGEFA